VIRVTDTPATPNAQWSGDTPDPATSKAPYRLYNIGNSSPVQLGRMIEVLEDALGRPAKKRLLDMQPGDVAATYADVDDLERDVGFRPATTIEDGVRRFVDWYCSYHGIERLAGTA
jgi:UDP-glucuronate 4-epimerase